MDSMAARLKTAFLITVNIDTAMRQAHKAVLCCPPPASHHTNGTYRQNAASQADKQNKHADNK